jgi:hypothetical protein
MLHKFGCVDLKSTNFAWSYSTASTPIKVHAFNFFPTIIGYDMYVQVLYRRTFPVASVQTQRRSTFPVVSIVVLELQETVLWHQNVYRVNTNISTSLILFTTWLSRSELHTQWWIQRRVSAHTHTHTQSCKSRQVTTFANLPISHYTAFEAQHFKSDYRIYAFIAIIT